jgi:succinate dehydrogenase flavin-adding protein (antitoxin of CptAB toxin-antitoxin module)
MAMVFLRPDFFIFYVRMTDLDFTPDGFPTVFSALVAEASMTLPPLVQEGDSQFLVLMLGKTADTFWKEYVSGMSDEALREMQNALQQESPDQLFQWFAEYADFENNPEARGLATAIVESMREDLPALIQEDYRTYHQSLST